MDGAEVAVLVSAVAGIAWVNWYFFLAEREVAAAVVSGAGTQEVSIVVRGGYEPAVVRVKQGVPVRLVFDRAETSGCSEEVVFPDFGVKKFLPSFEKTTV